MARLQIENQALWRVVDELRRDATVRGAEMDMMRTELQRIVASETGISVGSPGPIHPQRTEATAREEGIPPE